MTRLELERARDRLDGPATAPRRRHRAKAATMKRRRGTVARWIGGLFGGGRPAWSLTHKGGRRTRSGRFA